MSKLNKTILLALVTYTCSAFTTLGRSVVAQKPLEVFSKEVILVKPVIEVEPFGLTNNKLEDFMYAMAERESSNNPRVVNRWGYMGLYQFGRATLNSIGYRNVSNRKFLRDVSIQHAAMITLLKHNRRTLKRQIKKYNGKVVHGIQITESGILAAAHLGGAGSVKKFLRTGKNKRDGLGTPITEYMKRFSGYDLQNLK